jgi:predicted phage terminase large subunit-like protein
VRAVAMAQELRRRLVRQAVLRDGRLDVLAEHVLGYQVLPFHKRLLDFQTQAGDRALQLAPRGMGKSTMLTITRAVYEIVKNPDIRIIIASNTQIQAEVFLREIKHHLAQNERFIEHFGSYQSDDKWDAREIVVRQRTSGAKESTVTCLGVGGPGASRHYDLGLFDDLVDEENARTETQREYLRVWMKKTLTPTIEPEGRKFINGTRYHHLDLYGELMRDDYAGHSDVIDCFTDEDETESQWPEKFPVSWLRTQREDLGTVIFNAQYRNNTDLMKGHIFKEEWFREYDVEPNWAEMLHFVGCDPAATKRAALSHADDGESDWWTIVVGACYAYEQDPRIYLREVWRDRCTKDAYLTKLKEFKDLYSPVAVGIEDTQAQEYLAQDAEEFMPVHRVPRSVDKVARAYWLQPKFENGLVCGPAPALQRHKTWNALRDELLLFPKGKHDDLFDGLQTMVDVLLEYRGYADDVEATVTQPLAESYSEDDLL